MTTTLREVVEVLLLMIILVGGSWYAGDRHGIDKTAEANAVAVQKAAGKVADFNKLNTQLAADKATADARLAALQQQIATQPKKEKIVYVPTKATASNPTPAPDAVSGPVYITVGAAGLFNSAFGVSDLSGAATVSNEAVRELPSVTDIATYESTTLNNAAICSNDHTNAAVLQRFVAGLQAAGVVAKY